MSSMERKGLSPYWGNSGEPTNGLHLPEALCMQSGKTHVLTAAAVLGNRSKQLFLLHLMAGH